MGIGEWFGRGKTQPEEPPTPAAPTREDLLAALDRVLDQARDARVPAIVMSRLTRVTSTVRETIPRLDALGAGSPQIYSVMATATNYLPDALGGYLRLPRQWADTRPVDRGKTSLMILIDQLDLLGATTEKVFDAVCRADAEALVVHGRFLQEKFGGASDGGSLALGATSSTPAPSTSAPSVATGSPAGSGTAVPAGRSAEPERLAPPNAQEV